ncbi:MAG: HAD family hydrolase, partial [Candidatus Heimdallarchaeota archaeon]
MYDTILFDADNTIFNNFDIHITVTKRILNDLGLPLSKAEDLHSKWDYHYFSDEKKTFEEFGFCIDRENNARSLMKALNEINIEIPFEQALGYYHFMIEEYSEKSKPFIDVPEVLQYLAENKVKMAIVSNGDFDIINNRLKNTQLDHYFEFVVAPCEEIPLSKPNKAFFTKSLQMINSTPEKTVFIGDNPRADIMGGNKAGMFTVLIDRDDLHTELEGLEVPNKRIKSFTELKEIFS